MAAIHDRAMRCVQRFRARFVTTLSRSTATLRIQNNATAVPTIERRSRSYVPAFDRQLEMTEDRPNPLTHTL